MCAYACVSFLLAQAFSCLSPGFSNQHSHLFAGCQRVCGASARRAWEGLNIHMKWGLSNCCFYWIHTICPQLSRSSQRSVHSPTETRSPCLRLWKAASGTPQRQRAHLEKHHEKKVIKLPENMWLHRFSRSGIHQICQCSAGFLYPIKFTCLFATFRVWQCCDVCTHYHTVTLISISSSPAPKVLYWCSSPPLFWDAASTHPPLFWNVSLLL